MLRDLLHRRLSAQRTMRVDQYLRTQRRTAVLALIAISPGIAANGAGPDDKSICEKGLGFFVIILFAFFFDKLSPVVQIGEPFPRGLMMDRLAGPVIDIEGYAQIGEILFDQFMVFVD